jgi:hypothetical protein
VVQNELVVQNESVVQNEFDFANEENPHDKLDRRPHITQRGEDDLSLMLPTTSFSFGVTSGTIDMDGPMIR